ncbi:hypothetical protein [Amycolatopsis sp. PS_44_ISF1]|uniref:hypothetical protein n=1 Tax=Amycolatopsis sp. PS_44_ISF1 TaxID=2974917 RepID=UPI0028DEFBB5|nr:hypothetical protein [Amycolatopsis sp. PS_44_ISF1]MDT8915757.1 hypothetical protein [Amycolatopsis sp. PS_44_ISF1]MDT8916299.1 hypothetical protein [Amycolatopsis sp. PS_44_ISF1]
MTVPYPDPAVITLLGELPCLAPVGGRVSTQLDSTLPALRITKVSDREGPTPQEATPLFQVEVWAEDEFIAGSLAWALRNEWPSAKRQLVGDTLVYGRWIAADPTPSPDPETDLPRFLVTVGIRLSGATPS